MKSAGNNMGLLKMQDNRKMQESPKYGDSKTFIIPCELNWNKQESWVAGTSVRENVRNLSKNVISHVFCDFQKKR